MTDQPTINQLAADLVKAEAILLGQPVMARTDAELQAKRQALLDYARAKEAFDDWRGDNRK
jgi:hypothetical protein